MKATPQFTLLDGGMGQELIRRSKEPPSPLWSAHVLMNEPEIVEAAHRDFITAGADIITLNAYSATPERLARDASEDLFKPLQEKAIEVARNAIADAPVRLAGCLPPLHGSYHPEWAPDFDTCFDTYRRVAACQQADVDVMLAETMSSIKEATAATRAGKETEKPVWCALSVMERDGSRLRSGEPLLEAVEAVAQEGADVILLNCSPPEAISQGLEIMAEKPFAFGAYANGFTKADDLEIGGTVSHLETRTDLGPCQYADICDRWIDLGAAVIGGCCEIGPAHIAELRKRHPHA